MSKWIKYNSADDYITVGDQDDYWTPGWKGRLAEFLTDWGVPMLPCEEGWDVWVYEQGVGKFCWKYGEKKFCQLEWPEADTLLEGYEVAKAARIQRLADEEAAFKAAAAKG